MSFNEHNLSEVVEEHRLSSKRKSATFEANRLDSFNDRSDFRPCLAGIGHIEGKRLTLRVGRSAVRVDATAILLKTTLTLCDGTRRWSEILNAVPTSKRYTLEQFLEFLIGVGALIDAPLALAHAMNKASFSASGQAGHQSRAIATRNREVSVCWPLVCIGPKSLFGKTRVNSRTIRSILSSGLPSAAQVQDSALRWFLALQEPVDEIASGVYVASREHNGSVRLTPHQAIGQGLARLFSHPDAVAPATAGLFAIYDVNKGATLYGDCALRHQLLAAGASMARLSDSAKTFNTQIFINEDQRSEDIVSYLGLASTPGELRHQVFVSALLGSLPSTTEKHLASNAATFEFNWRTIVYGAKRAPTYIARSTIIAKPTTSHIVDTAEVTGVGRDSNAAVALLKSQAEAIERLAMRSPRDLVQSRYCELNSSLHPARYIAYSEAQYRRRAFPFSRFNESNVYSWVPAKQLSDGSSHHVLAEFVYGSAYLPSNEAKKRVTTTNSSGCAAHQNMELATKAALYEVIERDAFMRAWFEQRGGTSIPSAAFDPTQRLRVERLSAFGFDVALQILPSCIGVVVMASAKHARRYLLCVGLAASWSMDLALQSALDELETLSENAIQGVFNRSVSLKHVATPMDHAVLYAKKRYFCRADALFTPKLTYSAKRLLSIREPTSAELVEQLQQLKLEAYVVDMTPANAAIEQGRIKLKVVKAIIPSLIPITFGYGLEPRGMMQHRRPASFFPHPFA